MISMYPIRFFEPCYHAFLIVKLIRFFLKQFHGLFQPFHTSALISLIFVPIG